MFTRNHSPAAIVTKMASALALCCSPVFAGETCYDFSHLAVGTTYQIGDEVDISVGKVHIRNLIKDGAEFVPQNPIDQKLEVRQSRIALGVASPEIAVNFAGFQIELDKPAKEVSMKVAQQLGVTGLLPAYVEINGHLDDFRGSFNEANGIFGTLLNGVSFFGDLVQDAPGPNGELSYWYRGKIRARALLGGAIDTISVGAQIAHFDEVCIYD